MVRNVRTFEIPIGDNPDWWWAQRFMPGAKNDGYWQQVVLDTEDSALYESTWPSFDLEIRAGRSVFRTSMTARNREEMQAACLAIGGLRLAGHGSLSLFSKARLFCRYYWLRRPQITFRTPV